VWNFPLIPDQASSIAPRVDAVYIALVGFTGFIIVLVCALVIFFSVRYRRDSKHSRRQGRNVGFLIELAWSVPLFVIAIVIFVWAGRVYFDMRTIPEESMNIYVLGKQWMWQFEHADGRREMNNLHVPVNETIKLTMTSQDVIHSMYVPAFRIKMDVRPDVYSETWFKPTKVGTYHLFCAEYCGTEHSLMRGRITVMERDEYQEWLAGQLASTAQASSDLSGAALLDSLNCNSCHQPGGAIECPPLESIFGTMVELAGGSRVRADEQYIRESILSPNAKITAGYEPLMPTYRGTITESQIARVIEYLRESAAAESDDAANGTNAGTDETDNERP